MKVTSFLKYFRSVGLDPRETFYIPVQIWICLLYFVIVELKMFFGMKGGYLWHRIHPSILYLYIEI